MVEYYAGLSQHINFTQLPNPVGRFDLIEIIGEGTYGEVYHAKSKENGKSVAVKIMENIGDNIEEIDEEYLVLRDLCLHPNIPSFYGIYLKLGSRRDEDQFWIVMELCGGGSVTDLVQGLKKQGERLPEKIIAFILKETMDALYYLHRNHCMHRDVKGHNILLTEEGNVKLVDFGVSSHLSSTLGKRQTSVGTPFWMAAEVIACEQQLECSYDVRCDVWSLGITAVELAEGDPPLAHLHPMRALFHIPRNPPPTLRKPQDWSKEFNDFIAECLVKDYEQRPMVCELLTHPFIKQVPYYVDELRNQLKRIVAKVKQKNVAHRIPVATTKHGKLKTDRKSRAQPMLVEDLATLENLTESIIVDQLCKRFNLSQIYTYIGDILIAVNPFKTIDLYGESQSQMYRNRSKSDIPPHVYAVADGAYHSMIHQKLSQCVVISGESGAGKTESANLLLRQLVALGKAPNRNLEMKILQINPLMEAFGNAKTGINVNSSRFGKYLDITFTKTGKVTGAKLSVYLLEQSRIVSQAKGEENFHIFYYLYDGLGEEGRLSDYFLHSHWNGRGHRYLQSYSGRGSSTVSNVQCFKRIQQGFQLLGFRPNDTDAIFSILAAILHLGDIVFEDSEAKHNSNRCAIKNPGLVPVIARLLGVNSDSLVDAFTTNNVVTKGESILKFNSVQEAESTRDAMAKALYGRLFDWIVNQINRLLSPGRIAYGDPLAVGLLDIFGFENFKTNSFEQLCINIANEQIQYYFNQHIFRWEQQEYLSENIPVELVSFNDNRPLLDMLLSKPLGLLALLDEESHFPKSTDNSLIDKFHNNIKSSFYVRPKGNALNFTVIHYAGKVTYDARHFLAKNRYYIPVEVVQLYRQSSMIIVQSLFGSPLTKTGHLYTALPTEANDPDRFAMATDHFNDSTVYVGLVSQTKAQQTVSTYFRFSLMDLLHKLTHGQPHFVRCLKPNDQKLAMSFSKEKILEQLQYTGIMETIKIRQQGFSHRIPYADFLRRYSFLVFNFDERVIANQETCRLLLLRLNMDGWAIGKTKVFLKYYHVEYLSRLYEAQMRKIVCVQAFARRWLAKRRAEKEKWSVARSVLIVQKYARGWLARKRVNTIRRSSGSNSPEAGIKRRVIDDLQFRHRHQPPENSADAAVLIQKHVRGYLTRKKIRSPKQKQTEVKELPKDPVRNQGQQAKFVSGRMQSYQQDSSLDYYNQVNQPPIRQLDQRQSKEPQVNNKKTENNRNVNKNITKNGHNYPNHFKQFDLPLNINFPFSDDDNWDAPLICYENTKLRPRSKLHGKGRKDESIILINSINQSYSTQLQQTQEKENVISRKWWELIKQSSVEADSESTASSGKSQVNDRPTPRPSVQQQAQVSPTHGVKDARIKSVPVTPSTTPQVDVPTMISLHQSKLTEGQTKEPRTLVDVESWWQRRSSNQYGVSSTEGVSDQGPFAFRKILKPTSRNTNRSLDGSVPDLRNVQSETGPFDFRKMLRKTDHAPTDTLKRCKGLLVTADSSQV